MGLPKVLRMGRAVGRPSVPCPMPPPLPQASPDPEQAGEVPSPLPPPPPPPGEPHRPGTGSGGALTKHPAGGSCARTRARYSLPWALVPVWDNREPGAASLAMAGHEGGQRKLGLWPSPAPGFLPLERPAPGGWADRGAQLLTVPIEASGLQSPTTNTRLPHRADRARRFSPHRRPEACPQPPSRLSGRSCGAFFSASRSRSEGATGAHIGGPSAQGTRCNPLWRPAPRPPPRAGTRAHARRLSSWRRGAGVGRGAAQVCLSVSAAARAPRPGHLPLLCSSPGLPSKVTKSRFCLFAPQCPLL